MYIAIVAWLAGLGFSYWNGNRKLPTIVLLLGCISLYLWFNGVGGGLGIAGVAILAAIIWIANKADMM